VPDTPSKSRSKHDAQHSTKTAPRPKVKKDVKGSKDIVVTDGDVIQPSPEINYGKLEKKIERVDPSPPRQEVVTTKKKSSLKAKDLLQVPNTETENNQNAGDETEDSDYEMQSELFDFMKIKETDSYAIKKYKHGTVFKGQIQEQNGNRHGYGI
jgi:hypothetical protein